LRIYPAFSSHEFNCSRLGTSVWFCNNSIRSLNEKDWLTSRGNSVEDSTCVDKEMKTSRIKLRQGGHYCSPKKKSQARQALYAFVACRVKARRAVFADLAHEFPWGPSQ